MDLVYHRKLFIGVVVNTSRNKDYHTVKIKACFCIAVTIQFITMFVCLFLTVDLYCINHSVARQHK